MMLVGLFSSGNSYAGSRAKRTVGLGIDYYASATVLGDLAIQMGEVFRLDLAGGKVLNYPITLVRGGLHLLPLKSDVSPLIGIEYWYLSAKVSGYTLQGGAVAIPVGVDWVSQGGFHLGAMLDIFPSYGVGLGLAFGVFF